MKKENFVYYSLIFFILSLCSCKSDFDLDSTLGQNDSYVDFHFSKGSLSRINIDEDTGDGEFEKGDKVILYSYIQNSDTKRFELTYNGRQWLPRLTVEDLGGQFANLNAFYPVDDNRRMEGNRYQYEIPLNQQNKENFMQADLLGAYYSILSNEITSITMSFRHLMFRVNIDCSGIPDKIAEIKVRGKRKGFVQLDGGTLFLDNASDFEWITPYTISGSDNKRFAAILFPMENKYETIYKPEDLQVKLSIIDSKGETKDFHYKVSEKSLKELKSGNSFTIKLYKKGEEPVDKEFANKKLWVYGVESPVSPGTGNVPKYDIYRPEYPNHVQYPRNEWFYFDKGFNDDEEYQYILWQEGCNWFDCDKTFMKDDADDKNLCWAASASNMLHWWIYNNKEYIDLYDELHKDDTFKRPSADFNEKDKSEIFKFFINTFIDRGSSNTDGINWFLTGAMGSNLPGIDNPEMENFTGFFSDVFGKNQKIAVLHRSLSKVKFNEVIKDALKNNKAIGYDVTYKGGGYNHAMVVWGAEFDEFGNVSYLYTCDNDGRDQDPGAMCRRQQIIYKESDDEYEHGEYTFIKTTSGYANKILGVHTLGLEWEKWEQWKTKNGR